MAFTATLEGVQRSGDPLKVQIAVAYLDSTLPDWKVTKTIDITLDANMTAAQQKVAIADAVRADARPYLRQHQAVAGLTDMIGQTLDVT